MRTMSGTTCLVTGATSGIGKETALRLAMLGATVIIVARDAARGAAAEAEIRRRVPLAQVEVMTADLSSLAQVRRLAAEVLARQDRLDVLVNNAGVISMRRQLTADGLETTFATNHLGPFLLTNMLRGLLERSAPARVVTVSSAAHKQVRDVPWDGLAYGERFSQAHAYPLSKLLNILFTAELARRLASTGVTANCLHPGFVRTSLARDVTGVLGAVLPIVLRFRPGPATGAKTSVYLASSPEVADVTGRYFVKCKPARPSALARDDQAAARLWALSEDLTGLATRLLRHHSPRQPGRRSSGTVRRVSGMAIARFPSVVLDCPDPDALATFYGAMLGWKVKTESGWAEIRAEYGDCIGFQRVEGYTAPKWPSQEVPQQMHLDVAVDDLDTAEAAVLELGATKAEHQPGKTFRVFLDPAGHPFCLCLD